MEPSASSIRHSNSLFRLTALMLIVAPLFRAANRPLPLLVLELGAVAMLLIAFWSPPRLLNLTPLMRWALLALFLLPLVYLLPLPDFLWRALPGREIYTGLLDHTGSGTAWRPAGLVPLNAETAWLSLLPPIAVFIATMRFDEAALKAMIHVLFAVAGVQALLGLLQYGAGPDSALYFGIPMGGNATGTYANRNHLSGLLEMVFPVSLALTVASIGQGSTGQGRRSRWRARLDYLSSGKGHKALAYGTLTLLFLLAIIFTRSRTGIALSMFGILVSVFAFSRHIGGNNVYGTLGTLLAGSIGIAAIIGLAPVLDRFSTGGNVEEARIRIFSSTLQGIGEFFPVGSGPGSYSETYPRFEPPALAHGQLVNHAHNDYLEWLYEGGLLAAVLIIVFATIYLRGWSRIRMRGDWDIVQFIQVGSGIGILLILLHGLTDFNQRIPANMIVLAFLAGVFLNPAKGKATAARRRHEPRRRHRKRPQSPVPAEPAVSKPANTENARNPFMD